MAIKNRVKHAKSAIPDSAERKMKKRVMVMVESR
jgi:hypothetical protein